ncbi:probable ribonuclease 11 [Cricetulus griseus]|uniref:Probable ribonuclease 11 n=1 Tax=Cricetulus griseus TaxID=10029 RepID=A0A9J7EYQ9_CRIGR|nr:probable ribonuclease 11 [Cricetulus griseus]XP_027242293.1 probable ribonuclease 11 [Cricetulus griseus]
MAVFVLLLGLGSVLVVPSEGTTTRIREKLSQEEMQHAAKQTVEPSMNSTLSDKNISLGVPKNVMSASPPTSRRLYFVTPKGNPLSNEQNCLNGPRVWRKVLDMNESCQLVNNFIHGSTDVIHGVPEATSWKWGQSPSLSCCESLRLEHTMCKVTAGQQCPRCQKHSVTSLKRALTVLTSHSLMSWLVSGSKL